MSSSILTKALYTDITRLKLLDKDDAEVKFRLKRSPFTGDEDEDELNSQKHEEYVVIGQIFPNSRIYRERSYLIEMKLTKTLSMCPPKVRFLTPIYHLNVRLDGIFCYELLETYAVWTPRTSLIQVLKAVINSIDYPNVDYSASVEMGREYQYYREDYNRKALEFVRKHGLPRS